MIDAGAEEYCGSILSTCCGRSINSAIDAELTNWGSMFSPLGQYCYRSGGTTPWVSLLRSATLLAYQRVDLHYHIIVLRWNITGTNIFQLWYQVVCPQRRGDSSEWVKSPFYILNGRQRGFFRGCMWQSDKRCPEFCRSCPEEKAIK